MHVVNGWFIQRRSHIHVAMSVLQIEILASRLVKTEEIAIFMKLLTFLIIANLL